MDPPMAAELRILPLDDLLRPSSSSRLSQRSSFPAPEPGAPPTASTRGVELPATRGPPTPPATDASRPSAPLATFPRAPSGAGLGKGRAKRGGLSFCSFAPSKPL
jgi:hypothetical protein